jgi:hypothetical protein
MMHLASPIGPPMTGDQLKRKLTAIYGPKFHIPVAAELEVDKSTVYRWVEAKGKVPGIVASWINAKMAGRGTATANSSSHPD